MALPRTLGELQLYRVLQRANLLGYYETFIQQGGDDVQQLCEAGEEEFLEIMALVGMATKPLHVRRLQKALREWASNPGLFSQPVSAVPVSSIPLFKLSEAGGRKALSNGHASPGEAAGKGGSSAGTPPARSPTEPGEKLSPSAAPPWPGRSTPESEGGGDEEPGGPPFSPGGSGGEQPAGVEALEPELARTVAESVERLLQSCPRSGEAELRALMKLNKKLAKAVGHIFQLEDGDRHKEEEIRRHSAIYGRGEARRREGKQLTLHELIINEAAAQFCLRDNSLLLRRVELFSLSRQVARESTYLSSLKVASPCPPGATAGLPFPFALQLLPLFATPGSICAKAPSRTIPLPRPARAAAHACRRGWRCPQRGRRPGGHACREASARPPPRLTRPLLLPLHRAHPEESGATAAKRLKQEVAVGIHGALCSATRSWQAGEQSRPELLPLGPEAPGAAYRASLEEDAASLSGESLDGHLQAVGACPRLTPPPGAAPDVPLGLPPHGLWSRHILQQTLMDEGLRLARLVSHERVGRLSPCLPGKPPGPEFEDGLAERGPPAPPDPPRGTIKVEQETSRQ
ncbi:hypothetical protein QYF61_006345 [Mycteria americana]|uniref:NAB2 protein n=1 Tax=Mycteria americana TaxID=33587 RepID=A0AAN7MK42_MYCAM|nr:hypothetical protein QYF61_006345 [Mycteria americana]